MNKERTNYVLRKILLVLSNEVSQRRLSFQEIARQAKERFGIDLTPYQIRSVANGKFQENKVIPTLNVYIDAVLKTLIIFPKLLALH